MSIRETYPGLRVLELAAVVAGPLAAMVLADLGADVIKIENPEGGDDSRKMPPTQDGQSTLYSTMNRNKRSLALDLKSTHGREAVLRLAATADVVIESFRPGVAERLGVGYLQLRAVNPALIYCSVSAFGESPSGHALPGYDPLIQAFSGLMSMTGDANTPPSRVAASLIDLSTGMWAAMGIMAALARVAQTGKGQYVEATLVDSGYMLLGHQISSMLATGVVPGRLGSASPIAAPNEAFRTGDGWLMITAGNDAMFKRLCETLDLSSLVAREDFRTNTARVANREHLRECLQARLIEGSTAMWLSRLQDAHVPAAPVQDLAQAVAHPLMTERGMLVPAEDASATHVPLLRLPFDDARPPRLRRAPTLGEHSVEILREVGFTAEEISQMLAPATRQA